MQNSLRWLAGAANKLTGRSRQRDEGPLPEADTLQPEAESPEPEAIEVNDGLPLPPPALRYRVAGTPDANWFVTSGRLTADSFEAALAGMSRHFAEFSDIYDFGAGCGRVLRALMQRAPSARFAATDIDAPAIEWMQRYLPQVDARVNEGLPPLSFEDERFDLVVAFSVFTHLDDRYQDAWLTELQRVTRPGAILLATVHGEHNWQDHLSLLPGIEEHLPTLEQQGFLYYDGDLWSQYFPDFYHTSFHRPWYVRQHWSKWFDVLDILPAGAQPPQDLVILRRR